MPASDHLVVRGVGLRMAGVAEPGDLVRQVAGRSAAPRTVRRFEAPHTDLAPVDRRSSGPVEPRMPPGVATRGLRALPHESSLALAAAVEAEAAAGAAEGIPPIAVGDPGALRRGAPGPAPGAVVWASSSAGLVEYATICVEAALLDPGLSSPIIGPASAFNGPAATVSIRLGLNGPNETLTGGTTAGLSALVEAARFIADGDAGRALVGASATVSRWSLPGTAGTGDPAAPDPAEGAACLAVEPCGDGAAGIRLGPCRRVGLDRSRLVTGAREFVRGAPVRGPVIVSTPGADLVEALRADRRGPVWHVERTLGDLGAAGGFLAVVAAVAYCASAPPATVLAVAVEPSGNASLMEVSRWAPATSPNGC